MRTILNYTVCTVALLVDVVLILSGSFAWTLVGFAWSFGLYMWGEAFPSYWRKYWVTNMRILKLWGCI